MRLRWDLDNQQASDFVPVPSGLAEESKGGGVIVMLRQSGRFPDATDGASPEAHNPCSQHLAKRLKDFGAKALGIGSYQSAQRRSKLVHERDLHSRGTGLFLPNPELTARRVNPLTFFARRAVLLAREVPNFSRSQPHLFTASQRGDARATWGSTNVSYHAAYAMSEE